MYGSRVYLAALVFACAAAGCANNPLVGTWRGSVDAPGLTSIAQATVEFKKGGGITEAFSTPAGTVSGIGTFEAKGDGIVVRPLHVTFSDAGTTLGNDPRGQTATMKWEGDDLTILQGGATITLHRVKP
jgi:hypothetical protein